MSKEFKNRRDEKKKPIMSLKERRAKKHDKKSLKDDRAADSTSI